MNTNQRDEELTTMQLTSITNLTPPMTDEGSNDGKLVVVENNKNSTEGEDATQGDEEGTPIKKKAKRGRTPGSAKNVARIVPVEGKNGDNTFVCPICGHLCTTNHELTGHIRMHNTDKSSTSHTCTICSKTLSSASSLDRHMLVHSGERPFKCRICKMAFTTNGNMHRHMRTHGITEDGSPTKSKGRGPSKRKLILDEVEENLENSPPKKKSDSEQPLVEDDDKDGELHCPVCSKSFLCKKGLENHLETHPNVTVQCNACGLYFKNNKILIQHQLLIHKSHTEILEELPSPIKIPVGFHDISFVDFSSKKFPLIAKSFCENNTRRPSSAFLRFVCELCEKAFPCGSSLKMHKNNHKTNTNPHCVMCSCNISSKKFLDVHHLSHKCPEGCLIQKAEALDAESKENRKEDFLALLCLQTKNSVPLEEDLSEDSFNNASYFITGCPTDNFHHNNISENTTPNSNDDASSDFADIPTILKVTNTYGVLKTFTEAPSIVVPETSKLNSNIEENKLNVYKQLENKLENEEKDKSTSINGLRKDIMKALIKKHTARNKNNSFSCRHCKLTFNNYRLLLGHQRTHLGGSPYKCNHCPYSSADKSTLIRHLRTHNGERPFKCALCCFAFTTKANCERHVKKKHQKFSKQELNSTVQYNSKMTEYAISPDAFHCPDTVCKFCKEDFKFHRLLRHHMRSSNSSCNFKPFHCSLCNIGFSTKNNCIRHITKQHPKERISNIMYISNNNSLKSRSPKHKILPENMLLPIIAAEHTDITEPVLMPVESLVLMPEQQTFHFSSAEEKSFQESKDENTSLQSVNTDEPIDFSLNSCSQEKFEEQTEPLDFSNASVKPIDLSMKSKSCDNFLASSPLQPDKLLMTPNSTPMIISNKEERKCPRCNIAFRTLVLLQSHIKTHRDLRPFCCLHCSAGFTIKGNLDRHIRIKHPEHAKPYSTRQYTPRSKNSLKVKKSVSIQKIEAKPIIPVSPNNLKQNDTTEKTSQQSVKIFKSSNSFQPSNSLQSMPSMKSSNTLQQSNTLHSSPNLQPANSLQIVNTLRPTNNFPPANNLQTINAFEIGSDEKLPIQLPIKIINCSTSDSDLVSVTKLLSTAKTNYFKGLLKNQDTEEVKLTDGLNEIKSEPLAFSLGLKKKKRNSYSDSPMKVNCPYCRRSFPWESSLQRHLLTHTGLKPYQCPECHINFSTKSNCERHVLRKHGKNLSESIPRPTHTYSNSNERPYKCNTCNSTFSTEGNLRRHYQQQHPNEKLPKFKSEKIKAKLKKKWIELNEAKNKCPNESEILDVTLGNALDLKMDTKVEDLSEDEAIIRCRKCRMKMNSSEEYAQHLNDHNEFPYKCHLCEAAFPDRIKCLDHLENNHNDDYKILMQKNEILIKEAEKAEEILPPKISANHHHQRKVICCLCSKRFWSAQDLRRHMYTHSGERPFKCNICQQSFTLKHSMLRHRRKHLGIDSGEDDRIPSDNEYDTLVQESQGVDQLNENSNNKESNDLIQTFNAPVEVQNDTVDTFR